MKLKMFMDAMQAIENDRKLTKEIVVSALEEALIKAYRKHIEIPDALVRVDISEKTGAIRVFQERQVVENVEDDEMEISLEDAQRINKDYQPPVSPVLLFFVNMLPFLITALILVITSIRGSKGAHIPASLGVNYFREER